MVENSLFTNRQLMRRVYTLMVDQSLTMLVGICDSMMVSTEGEAAISGVALVDMINAVILVLFAALATGGAVVASQYLGAGKMDRARKSVGQMTLMAGMFGTAIMGLCLTHAEDLMKLFFGSAGEAVTEAGLIYLRINAVSFPFMALYNAGATVFRSVGNGKVPMKVSILMNILNVCGNAICILVLKMGVAGVAVPTLISRAVASVVILTLASKPSETVYLQKRSVFAFDRKLLGSILRIGVPSACENSLFQVERLLVGSMVALHGAVQTSAYSVANTLDNIGIVVGQSIALATVTIIGQCVGTKDKEQVKYYTKKMMTWAYLVVAAGNLVLVLLMDPLLMLYGSLSEHTISLAEKLILLHAGAGILLWPAAFVLPSALRAASDVKFVMWVDMVSMLIFRVGTTWLLCVGMGMGVLGAWYAMIIDWTCLALLFTARTLSGKWLKKYKAE